MKTKARVEKTVQNKVRSEKISEKAKGGGRLDGKGITSNSKGKTNDRSEGTDRKPF